MSKSTQQIRGVPTNVFCSLGVFFVNIGILFALTISSNADVKTCQSSNCLSKQEAIKSDIFPALLIEKPIIDTNSIRPVSKRTASFIVRNTGNNLLMITDVKKCCGTVVKIDPNEIEPGKKGIVTVTFNAGSKPGPIKKQISLFTNDPCQPETKLTVTGKVIETLTWSPPRLKLVWQGDKIICPNIALRNANGEQFAIKGAAVTDDCLAFQVDPNAQQDRFSILPQVNAEKLMAMKRPAGVIKLQLDHPDYKEITLG